MKENLSVCPKDKKKKKLPANFNRCAGILGNTLEGDFISLFKK
jgi:hypothetical protein